MSVILNIVHLLPLPKIFLNFLYCFFLTHYIFLPLLYSVFFLPFFLYLFLSLFTKIREIYKNARSNMYERMKQ